MSDLEGFKQRLERKKQATAEAKAAIRIHTQELKDDHDLKNVKEARRELKRLKSQRKKLEKQRKSKMELFKERHKDIL